MFSIAIENCQHPTYTTEKLHDCFATGTIPVYLGAPDVDSVFNGDGIIYLDDGFSIQDLSEDLYYSRMDAIRENLKLINEYAFPIEDYIYLKYLNKGEHND